MIEAKAPRPKLEISFVLRDKDGNIKEQGTELTEIAEVMKNGNIDK